MDHQIDHNKSELNALREVINDLIEKKNDSDDRRPEQSDNSPTNQPKPIRRRPNQSFPLNRFKFLNEEQQDQVLQFASDNKDEIMNQQSGKLIFQKQ